ncbi:beta-galactosidase [Neobacillus vireti]|uniref:beta-galactosidase n=1 Tax=Neobacillus vireti TaxID=220686 RepID=UPI002FFD81C1
MDKILYGVAYYDEYMPYERLEEDIRMMKEAGINFVRIAESTWSTHEPQNGVFDFTSVDRVLDAMHKADIKVIVGTPTYAVPTWLVKQHPDVLAVTKNGPGKYGARQIMDITNPVYLFHAERIIRKLINHVKDHPAVIGYQVDNETKHYRTAGDNVQFQFVKYLKEKFSTIEELNKAYGLSYWSNRINSWEDTPSMVGTINGSLGSEFSKFQRKLVTDFLAWQVGIVKEYSQPHQFVTHNFDFEWRGHSFGIQPDVDHYEASKAMDITGIDVYHPSQSQLTGAEISYCGDIARSTKNANYFVLETEAQAFKNWTPYPGQLRLQAYSHLASGADMVAYWHWHSIHNSAETYWKGLLSHDFKPNPVYNEAKVIGAEFQELSDHLVHLKKQNKVAFIISNESYTSMNWFPFSDNKNYNDVFRRLYDELYKLNIECDVINPTFTNLQEYDLLIVPSLYTVNDKFLHQLNDFVHQGGHVLYTFKSGFTNENVQVRTITQPGIISEACGVEYSLFVEPGLTGLKGFLLEIDSSEGPVQEWMELLTPSTADVLAYYDHPHWGQYAGITHNSYGKGTATYIGFFPSEAVVKSVIEFVISKIPSIEKENLGFPIITKAGKNQFGKNIRYYFNYSDNAETIRYTYSSGRELLCKKEVQTGDTLEIKPWDVVIIES